MIGKGPPRRYLGVLGLSRYGVAQKLMVKMSKLICSSTQMGRLEEEELDSTKSLS